MDDMSKTKVDVLFKEYDALRAEINERIRGGFGMQTVVVAGVAVWVQWPGRSWKAFGAAILILMLLWIWNERAIWHCRRRLKETENQINQEVGEPLLKWTSKGG
jgi:hypothetical protein